MKSPVPIVPILILISAFLFLSCNTQPSSGTFENYIESLPSDFQCMSGKDWCGQWRFKEVAFAFPTAISFDEQGVNATIPASVSYRTHNQYWTQWKQERDESTITFMFTKNAEGVWSFKGAQTNQWDNMIHWVRRLNKAKKGEQL